MFEIENTDNVVMPVVKLLNIESNIKLDLKVNSSLLDYFVGYIKT